VIIDQQYSKKISILSLQKFINHTNFLFHKAPQHCFGLLDTKFFQNPGEDQPTQVVDATQSKRFPPPGHIDLSYCMFGFLSHRYNSFFNVGQTYSWTQDNLNGYSHVLVKLTTVERIGLISLRVKSSTPYRIRVQHLTASDFNTLPRQSSTATLRNLW